MDDINIPEGKIIVETFEEEVDLEFTLSEDVVIIAIDGDGDIVVHINAKQTVPEQVRASGAIVSLLIGLLTDNTLRQKAYDHMQIIAKKQRGKLN